MELKLPNSRLQDCSKLKYVALKPLPLISSPYLNQDSIGKVIAWFQQIIAWVLGYILLICNIFSN